MHNEYQQVVD